MEKHELLGKMFDIVHDIKRESRIRNPLNKELLDNFEKNKIPPSGRELLRILHRNGNMNQRGLAKIMKISSQAVSELVKKLEINGYIEKKQGALNNENIIALTELGLQIGVAFQKRIKDDAEKAFVNFSEEDLKVFSELLGKFK